MAVLSFPVLSFNVMGLTPRRRQIESFVKKIAHGTLGPVSRPTDPNLTWEVRTAILNPVPLFLHPSQTIPASMTPGVFVLLAAGFSLCFGESINLT